MVNHDITPVLVDLLSNAEYSYSRDLKVTRLIILTLSTLAQSTRDIVEVMLETRNLNSTFDKAVKEFPNDMKILQAQLAFKTILQEYGFIQP